MSIEGQGHFFTIYFPGFACFVLYLDKISGERLQDHWSSGNLYQLIEEPTHFTETSSSIIDLVFTSNKNNIRSSGVGDPFLEQNVRYHCPVYFVLNFHKFIAPALNKHVWLYDHGNYLSFAQDIMETNWETLKNNNIDIYAQNVTNEISKLAKKTHSK